MKKLVLFTDGFPFGAGETFLENELVYLKKQFNVTIIAVTNETDEKRLDEDVKTIKIKKIKVPKRSLVFFFIKSLFTKDYRIELKRIIKSKNDIRQRLVMALQMIAKGEKLYKTIKKTNPALIGESDILYFYWNTYKLLPFLQRKKKLNKIIVSRIHGYDLYNERNSHGVQMFKSMNKKLNRLFFLSETARNYYADNFDSGVYDFSSISSLGVRNIYNIEIRPKREYRLICSCSRLVPLKRVELIIDALALIDNIKIKWVHFGDGECLNALKDRAFTALDCKDNIEYTFFGAVRNNKITEYYCANRPDCYILTSESEGVPVSVMEALSCGVPVISTDVGGVREMLGGTNNILVDKETDAAGISRAILNMFSYDEEKISEENIKKWEEAYNADVNYNSFVDFLNRMQ